MLTLPESDPAYSSGIIPVIANMQDRGTTLFDDKLTGSGTGSSITKAVGYCKDIQGCGDADYRKVVAAVTLNYLANCIPVLNGVLTLSGLFRNLATTAQLDDMITVLRTAGQGGFDGNASVICGVIP